MKIWYKFVNNNVPTYFASMLRFNRELYDIITWLDFWRETVVVVPDGGMCKPTIPGVKQSRASQWRARASRRLGASVDMVHRDYA